MKIKLSDIANIAEVIAAIAIVISLVFVGIQLKDNTRAMKSGSAIAASTSISQWYATVGSSAQISKLINNFFADPESLTAAERYQATVMMHSALAILQNNFYLAEQGTLDPRVNVSIVQALVVVKGTPGWDYYWKKRQEMFLPEFQTYIDELMQSGKEYSTELYQRSDE